MLLLSRILRFVLTMPTPIAGSVQWLHRLNKEKLREVQEKILWPSFKYLWRVSVFARGVVSKLLWAPAVGFGFASVASKRCCGKLTEFVMG